MEIPKREEIKQWGRWKIIWANSNNLVKSLKLVRAGELDGIGLSPHSGSDIFDLQPFIEWRDLQGMVLPYASNMDLSELGQMDFIRFLVLGEAPCAIDLSGFSSLVDLTLDWSKKLRLPESPHALRSLRIDGFSPADRGLAEVSKFTGLSKIEFVKGTFQRLEGCEEFDSLTEAQFHYLSKLETVKCLSKTPVKKVVITNCRNIIDLDSLVDCRNLEVLHYHDSAPLKSIDFVRRCKMLKEFRFVGVDVLDGDMTPLVGLKEFAFTRKKHFSHSEKMIRELQ